MHTCNFRRVVLFFATQHQQINIMSQWLDRLERWISPGRYRRRDTNNWGELDLSSQHVGNKSTNAKWKSETCWSYLSEYISRPMVYGRSVTVQRHRPCSNWKVWPTDLRSNLLTGIGSRDVYPSKNIKIIIIFILVLDFDISANKLLLSLCSILSSVVASWANHPHHYIILLIESPCPPSRCWQVFLPKKLKPL